MDGARYLFLKTIDYLMVYFLNPDWSINYNFWKPSQSSIKRSKRKIKNDKIKPNYPGKEKRNHQINEVNRK